MSKKIILFVVFLIALSLNHLISPSLSSAQGTCSCQTVFNGPIPIGCTPYTDLCTKPDYNPNCINIGPICFGSPNCTCDHNPPPPPPTPTAIPSCTINYLSCSYSAQCCSGFCDPSSRVCLPITPTTVPCFGLSQPCASDPANCCAGYYCNPSNPQICLPLSIPTSTPSCTANYLSCSSSSQCCSGYCNPQNPYICMPVGPTCVPDTRSCTTSSQCCSGYCNPQNPYICMPVASTPAYTCYTQPNSVCCNSPGTCTGTIISGRTCPGTNYTCCQGTCTTIYGKAPTPAPPGIFCDSSGHATSTRTDRMFTSLGCIPYNPTGFAAAILGWGLGMFAGLAFLILLYAAFNIATAQGDPKKIQAGKELIVAALTGLALIATAIVALNFLGVKVLNLGGLGFDVK